MALRNSPQLGFPKQLPEILPLIEAHPVSERNGVLGQFAIHRFKFPEEPIRLEQCLLELRAQARLLQLQWCGVAVKSGEALTLLSHHPVPMQIAIGANVHGDLESQVRVLEGAPDLLPSRGALRQIALE